MSVIALLKFEDAADLASAFRDALGGYSAKFSFRECSLSCEVLARESRDTAKVLGEDELDFSILFLGKKSLGKAEAVLRLARATAPECPLIVAMDEAAPEETLGLLELGAADFIFPPFSANNVLPRLWRLQRPISQEREMVLELKQRVGLKQLIGESAVLFREINKIPLVARCDASVLITGETGTGKEMFARAIHALSRRSDKPLNALNCGAIPVDLIENELFGHEAGAFTGANGSATGLLRETEGGTLFLDEIDSLPLLAQVKLLRFLQEKEFRPLGSSKVSRVDARIIAASNSNIQEALKKGRFRQDLYYRLNVVALSLPPLRERREDIPLLARHFLNHYATALDGPAREFSPGAMQKLMLYDWPGNVRELENVIERSVILSAHPCLRPEDVDLPNVLMEAEGETFRSLKDKTIKNFERAYIQNLLLSHGGNITKAALAAGKHRRAFWEMMRKHQMAGQMKPRHSEATRHRA
jgi:two-component system response regulator GlrR